MVNFNTVSTYIIETILTLHSGLKDATEVAHLLNLLAGRQIVTPFGAGVL